MNKNRKTCLKRAGSIQRMLQKNRKRSIDSTSANTPVINGVENI